MQQRQQQPHEEALGERFRQKSREVLEEKIPAGRIILGDITVKCRCHLCHSEDVNSSAIHWKQLKGLSGECFKCEGSVPIETAFLNRQREEITVVTPECTADKLLDELQVVADYRPGQALRCHPPIMAPPTLARAITNGDVQEVERLVNPENINCVVERGMRALFFACYHGKADVVSCLLNLGADVHAKSKDLMLAMHGAASGKNVEIVRLLHAKGASVNGSDTNGSTPLHNACMEGQLDICKFLVANNADVRAPTMTKATPLHQAAKNGNREIVALLISNRAPINTQDFWGRTPLANAIYFEKKEAGKALLDGGASLLNLKAELTIPDWAGGESARDIAVKDLRISQLEAQVKALTEKRGVNPRPVINQRCIEIETEKKAAETLCAQLEKQSQELAGQVVMLEDRSTKNRAASVKAQEANKKLLEEKKQHQKILERNSEIQEQNKQCNQQIKNLRQALADLHKMSRTVTCEAVQMPWQEEEELFNQRTALFEENKQRWQMATDKKNLCVEVGEIFRQRLRELETFMAKVKKAYVVENMHSSPLIALPEPLNMQEELQSKWLVLQSSATKLKNAADATLIHQRALELYPHLETLKAELKNLTAEIRELQENQEASEYQPSISLQ